MNENNVAHRIHSKLLRVGWLLDLSYYLAFYVLKVKDFIADRLASNNPVSMREVLSILPKVAQKALRVDVTTVCNARCTFCAYPKVTDAGTLKTGVMTTDLFKRVVTDFGKNGGTFLDLTPVVGEPLVDPELFQKIAFATEEAGIPDISMISNGILLDRNENYKRVVDSGLKHLSISTQGTDRAEYHKVYGVDKYDAFISGLGHLLAYNRQRGEPVDIRIRFRNSQKPSAIVSSRDYKTYIEPYLSDRVRVNFTVRYGNWAGTIQKADLPIRIRLSDERPQVNLPCLNLFSLSILPRGEIRMCGCILKTTDADELVVGHVAKDRVDSVLEQSQRVTEILNGFYTGARPPVCGNCTMYRPITRSWFDGVSSGSE